MKNIKWNRVTRKSWGKENVGARSRAIVASTILQENWHTDQARVEKALE